MAKNKELRGLIYSLYDTESDFAREIGWTRQRINKISNGAREPDINELNVLAHALGKTVGEMAEIFLRAKSPNEQLCESVNTNRTVAGPSA